MISVEYLASIVGITSEMDVVYTIAPILPMLKLCSLKFITFTLLKFFGALWRIRRDFVTSSYYKRKC